MVCPAGRGGVLLSLFLMLSLAGAAAAQIQTVPSQQIPKILPIPPPIRGQEPPEIPSLPPTLPQPQRNTREIPLPEVFRGCWSGSVSLVDSIQLLDPDAGQLIWLTKTYTLCYKQAGYNGKWQLTFAEGSVTDRIKVTDQRQSIRVKSVRGPDRAELTAYLHFRTNWLIGLGGLVPPRTLDELSHLHCDVLPDGNLMTVSAAVFVEANGEPYANINWHADFFRTGG
jgi:hypothetical protein